MPDETQAALRRQVLDAYERGDADALNLLAAALERQPGDGGLLIAEARALADAGDPRAMERLETMLDAAPDWLDGQVAWSQLQWESGARDQFLARFEAALRLLPGHAGLWFRYMTAIAGSGDPGRAADIARDLRRRSGDPPPLLLIEAHHAGMAGEVDRAEGLLDRIPDDVPGKKLEAARHRLRRGDARGAARMLESMRADGTIDGTGWALLELAWRHCGDQRHAWLIDPQRHVAPIDLELGEAALRRLAELLRSLHRASGRPLGQSIREGTQTRGNLWRRREPEIAALRERLEQAVAAFAAALPPAEPDHPLHACAQGPLGLATGWSVRLRSGGHHIGHIHAHGLLSSACYIALPEGIEDKEGWLELGRPPADIAIDLPPLAVVEPRPGRLVLFPSFLYHGTLPFRAGERLTVAFDVAPA